MKEFLKNKASIIDVLIIAVLFVGAAVGIGLTQPAQNQQLGATIPTPVALFETTLASSISSTATSMTLTSATYKDGNTLATSTYAFIIDEGTASEEFVTATCTGTSCTSMTRGVSVLTGNTSVTDLKKAHRRGASVKITDGPQLLILSRILNGDETLPNIISYASNPSFSSGSNEVASVKFAEDLANAGCANASETVLGCAELATGAEAAAGTSAGGTGARLVVPGSLFNATPSAAIIAPITSAAGKLAQGFWDLTEAFIFTNDVTVQGTFTSSGTTTLAAGTTVGGAAIPSAVDIQTFSSATSTTWTKPTAAKFVDIYVFGAGAGGGGGGSNNPTATGGTGGGAGEIVYHRFVASGLGSTEAVVVGAGGTGGAAIASGSGTGNNGTNGAQSSFGTNLIIAKGGTGGSGGAASGTQTGGAGGTGGNALTKIVGGAGGDNNGLGDVGDGGVDTTVLFSPRGGGAGGATGGYDGGAGGDFTTLSISGGAGGTGGTGNDGSDGTTGSATLFYGGTGGGGGEGGDLSTTAGGTGGDGGAFGGGGGGGGGSGGDSGIGSGAGGAGGDGAVIVVTYF